MILKNANIIKNYSIIFTIVIVMELKYKNLNCAILLSKR